MHRIHVNAKREKLRAGIKLRETLRRKLRAVPATERRAWGDTELLRWWVVTRASPEILELGGDDLDFPDVRTLAAPHLSS